MRARWATPVTEIPPAKISADSGLKRPAGNGRSRVRFIAASTSRSAYWFSALVPAASRPVPRSACSPSRRSAAPVEAR